MLENGSESGLLSQAVAQPGDEAVRSALSRLLASTQFANSPRARRFIQYVVERALAGEASSLKEYVLGVEVFDRSPSFDPRTDTIVRVEAIKLRERLRDYYGGPGSTDPVVIDVPKGAYAPAFRMRTIEKTVSPRAAGDRASIAVLPFTALSDAREDEYFSDGLAEEVINALTRVSGLKVIARTSAFAFKGKQADIREIAGTLGVTTVLEGSVRRAANRIRVAVQLINAEDGCHLWSQSYDREMNDVFAVQEEIAQAIVSVLKVKFSSQPDRPLAQRGTTNFEAYRAYFEGRYYFQQLTEEGMARSRECHERAIRLDPDFALPYVGMAEYYYYLAFYLNARPRDVLPPGLAAAERALELNPRSAEAYTIRGTLRAVYNYDWNGAGEDFDSAIELDPNLALAHHRRTTWFLRPTGRWEESLAELRHALELDPLNVLMRASEALALNIHGKKAEALQRARDLIQLFPGFWICCFMAGAVLGSQGLHAEAASVIRNGLGIDSGNSVLLAMLAAMQSRMGEPAEARRILGQIEDTASARYVSPAALVIACFACGEVDRAFAWLDKGVEERDPMTITAGCRLLPRFESDPRYHALMRKMNLETAITNDTGLSARVVTG
jgi:adenylate cyclase